MAGGGGGDLRNSESKAAVHNSDPLVLVFMLVDAMRHFFGAGHWNILQSVSKMFLKRLDETFADIEQHAMYGFKCQRFVVEVFDFHQRIARWVIRSDGGLHFFPDRL